jgi:hypothetical protein
VEVRCQVSDLTTFLGMRFTPLRKGQEKCSELPRPNRQPLNVRTAAQSLIPSIPLIILLLIVVSHSQVSHSAPRKISQFPLNSLMSQIRSAYISSTRPSIAPLATLIMTARVDAVVTTNDGPAHVLYNQTPTRNHWLTLTLVGHKSNRDAIGAEVKLTTVKGMQFVTVTTCGSYLSSGDKRVHFGLGPEAAAETVEIRWPSGIVQTLKDVKADQSLRVDEPTENIPAK